MYQSNCCGSVAKQQGCGNNNNKEKCILKSWPERIIYILQPNILYPVWYHTDSYGIYYRSGKTDIDFVPLPPPFRKLHYGVSYTRWSLILLSLCIYLRSRSGPRPGRVYWVVVYILYALANFLVYNFLCCCCSHNPAAWLSVTNCKSRNLQPSSCFNIHHTTVLDTRRDQPLILSLITEVNSQKGSWFRVSKLSSWV